MLTQFSIRLALLAALAAVPMVAGCDIDKHNTATGLPKSTGLTPNDNGPNGSGSISAEKVNSGGPGAPGTTKENPAK